MNTKKILAAVAACLVAASPLTTGMAAYAEGTENTTVSEETTEAPESEEEAEEAAPVDGVVFSAENYGDYIKITGFTGTADIAAIPADVAGIPVTSIGDITSDGSIGTLVIPSSVTSISENAFDNITGLSAIQVDGDNTKYAAENGVLYNKDMTKLLVYPYAKSDVTFTVPDSVTEIASEAFGSNTHLYELTLGNGITSVTVSELGLGRNVAVITLSASVTEAVLTSGKYGNQFQNIHVNEENTVFSSEDGVLFNKDKTELILFPGKIETPSYAVPDSVKAIAPAAFEGSKLVTITVPDSVETIGENAFANMSGLATAVLGSGIKELPANVFANDKALVSAALSSAEKIADNAFAKCASLKSISIPANTAEIDADAFAGCDALTDINVSSSNEVYSSVDGVLLSKDGTELIKYMYGRTEDAYTVPDSVKTICDRAFENCAAIAQLTLGASFEAFEGTPFTGCTSLSAFEVSADNAAFSAIDGVLFNADGTELIKYPCGRPAGEYIVPDSLTAINNTAFSDSANVTAFVVSDANTNFSAVDGILCSADGTTIVKYPSGAETDYVELSETITAIAEYAFDNAVNLEGLLFANDETAFAINAIVNPNKYLVLYGNTESTTKNFASLNSIEFIALDAEYAFGDVNADGAVDAVDASSILTVYALTSTGHRCKYIEAQKIAADIDLDGEINSSDTSKVLAYYAYASTTDGKVLSIADFCGVDDPTFEVEIIEPSTEAPTEEITIPSEEATEA
ncbi:MAG: hypothetical protein E7497_06750 [Ruminococcus sp.]|nr:hypothetical protein [Ruminococcus sp.]